MRYGYIGNTLKKLGEAELEIMQVIWDGDNISCDRSTGSNLYTFISLSG